MPLLGGLRDRTDVAHTVAGGKPPGKKSTTKSTPGEGKGEKLKRKNQKPKNYIQAACIWAEFATLQINLQLLLEWCG